MAGMPLTPRGWTSQPQYPAGINRSHPLAGRLLLLTVPGIDGGRTALRNYAATGVGRVPLPQGMAGDFSATSSIALPIGLIPDARFTVISGAITASGLDAGTTWDTLLGANYDNTSEPFTLRINYSGPVVEAITYGPGVDTAVA